MLRKSTVLPNGGTPMLTPEQLRAARALVDWSRDDLADKSDVSPNTVWGFEQGRSDPKLSTLNKWRRALEAAGSSSSTRTSTTAPACGCRKARESNWIASDDDGGHPRIFMSAQQARIERSLKRLGFQLERARKGVQGHRDRWRSRPKFSRRHDAGPDRALDEHYIKPKRRQRASRQRKGLCCASD